MTGRNYPAIRHDPSRIVTPFATRYGSGILDMSAQCWYSLRASVEMENVILASLPFNHERLLLLLLLLLSRLKEEILFLKILNVMLKCGTEYSGFNSVGI